MELRTERARIKEVAEMWDATYRPEFRPTNNGSSKAVSMKLHALNLDRVTAGTVNKIIGNDSWTKTHCNECESYTGWAIELGEPPDYESRTATLCRACFDKAVELVKAEVVA